MEKTLYIYTDNLDRLLQNLSATPTSRFPNLSVQETDDPTVYFDPRPNEGGFAWASPITALTDHAQKRHKTERLVHQAQQRAYHAVGHRCKTISGLATFLNWNASAM